MRYYGWSTNWHLSVHFTNQYNISPARLVETNQMSITHIELRLTYDCATSSLVNQVGRKLEQQ